MIEYLRLFQEGDSTIPARLDLLNEQMTALQEQKAQLEATMARLSVKIQHYEDALKTGKLVWHICSAVNATVSSPTHLMDGSTLGC